MLNGEDEEDDDEDEGQFTASQRLKFAVFHALSTVTKSLLRSTKKYPGQVLTAGYLLAIMIACHDQHPKARHMLWQLGLRGWPVPRLPGLCRRPGP